MTFSGKVVLITGASSGIGADAAIEFSKQGAKVALVGRNEVRLNAVVEKIKNNGSPTPIAIIADVSKEASHIIDQTIQQFGQIDVLVNNAGIVGADSASTINLEQFDNIFATNIRGVVELTKLAVPHLEKTKGNVINVSSIVGLTCAKGAVSYAMSKAALDMYTKCASLELAPKGIRVNAINPGMIKTPIFETTGASKSDVEVIQQNAVKNYPVGRIGEVADTSNAILFLANENSSFINGVLLPIEGGRMHV